MRIGIPEGMQINVILTDKVRLKGDKGGEQNLVFGDSLALLEYF